MVVEHLGSLLSWIYSILAKLISSSIRQWGAEHVPMDGRFELRLFNEVSQSLQQHQALTLPLRESEFSARESLA
jgi:hypothetical protein